jgi:REP element-mobilizing transposase RayT
VPHDPRPWLDPHQPLHVTVRSRRAVGHLRAFATARAMGQVLRRAATSPRKAAVQRRRTFRVVHFSIQPDHLHLIVEASSARALSRGLQGLLSAVARAVNKARRRRGPVLVDRYHARPLTTPTEVRHALVYVLANYKKHLGGVPDRGTVPRHGIDPCSSARWFDGWERPPPAEAQPAPVAPARTWLLQRGWRRRGLLARHERPAAHVCEAVEQQLPLE